MEMKQIMKRLGIMLLTLCLLVGMVGCGSSGSSSDANRQDAEKIKEDNQSAEGSSEVASTEAEVKVTKHTEYPLTITTYDNQGNEVVAEGDTIHEEDLFSVMYLVDNVIGTLD